MSRSVGQGGGLHWTTIESDPGVFTELITQMGAKDVQVEEIYGLDDVSSVHALEPVYGLILLFKWRPNDKDDRPIAKEHDLFFANQTVNNACATQAIISILLNTPEVNVGPILTDFKEFTKDFTPEYRGITLGSYEPIVKAHNSFARPEPFILDGKKLVDDEDDDVFHFISYVKHKNGVYELDGLKPGPIFLGSCEKGDWIEIAFNAVKKRIEKNKTDLHFTLLAVVKNRQALYQQEISKLELEKKKLLEEQMEVEGSKQDKVASIEQKIKDLQFNVQSEKEKFENWKIENIRRRHNYIPFIVNLLKSLAEQGQLGPLIEKAKANKKQ